MTTSLRSKWAAGAIRRAPFRRVFATCGTVGTRSRAIRGSTSDDRVGCSASNGRCAPARPALNVSTRLLSFLPRALASADGIRPFPLLAFCERAAPDAPETIDDQRRCTGCRYRTIYGGSRGSASLPRRHTHSCLLRTNCDGARVVSRTQSSGFISIRRTRPSPPLRMRSRSALAAISPCR